MAWHTFATRELLAMNVTICGLCIVNIFVWGYLFLQFFFEYGRKRKEKEGFYILIMLVVLMILSICVGTLFGRGIYLTNHIGVTASSEVSISYFNHIMQIVLGFVMFGLGGALIYKIWKKRMDEP